MALPPPAAWHRVRRTLAALAGIALTTVGAVRADDGRSALLARADALINEVRQRHPGCGAGAGLVASSASAAPMRVSDASADPARPALRWEPRLAQAARRHAGAMARTGIFDHVGADGTTVRDRVAATGYRWVTVGEAVAAGHASFERALGAWLASPAECDALLDARFTEYGLARALPDGSGDPPTVYWTLVLARPR